MRVALEISMHFKPRISIPEVLGLEMNHFMYLRNKMNNDIIAQNKAEEQMSPDEKKQYQVGKAMQAMIEETGGM